MAQASYPGLINRKPYNTPTLARRGRRGAFHTIKPLEIWFADEARVGQKNKITRRWAKRGTRPAAPKDQRTASAYIFGAICPAHGKGAGLVLPRCTTEGMTLHLNEIAQAVAPGAHALVLVDQAGWHQSKRLVVPDNITLDTVPAKAPESNPVENIWQYMRDNWISNRIFTWTEISSITAAKRGKSSRISPGSSSPSACGIGLTGSDHRDLVLKHFQAQRPEF